MFFSFIQKIKIFIIKIFLFLFSLLNEVLEKIISDVKKILVIKPTINPINEIIPSSDRPT